MFLVHDFIRDIYTPIWPNVAADLFTAAWIVRRVKVHLAKHRKWQYQHFMAIHKKIDGVNSDNG
jgi:hypothetical protein